MRCHQGSVSLCEIPAITLWSDPMTLLTDAEVPDTRFMSPIVAPCISKNIESWSAIMECVRQEAVVLAVHDDQRQVRSREFRCGRRHRCAQRMATE